MLSLMRTRERDYVVRDAIMMFVFFFFRYYHDFIPRHFVSSPIPY